MDNGTRPDIVVGASAYKYEESDDQGGGFGQDHPACNDTPAADTCIRSGRSYMYSGERTSSAPCPRRRWGPQPGT